MQTPAEYLQTSEPTEVISISRQNNEKLIRFREFVTFTNVMMEREFTQLDFYFKEFSQKNTKGKYEFSCQTSPQIIKRAKLDHIASIMGVTP